MKKVTITYSVKRTYPLEPYANITPCYSITEEIEVEDDYNPSLELARLKKVMREELNEEAKRIKHKDMTYMTPSQGYQIGKLTKEIFKIDPEFDGHEECKKFDAPCIPSLTEKNAGKFITHLEVCLKKLKENQQENK
jgi:hypothetical protein